MSGNNVNLGNFKIYFARKKMSGHNATLGNFKIYFARKKCLVIMVWS